MCARHRRRGMMNSQSPSKSDAIVFFIFFALLFAALGSASIPDAFYYFESIQ
jgi:hypothetical protein